MKTINDQVFPIITPFFQLILLINPDDINTEYEHPECMLHTRLNRIRPDA